MECKGGHTTYRIALLPKYAINKSAQKNIQ
jgi:hypothetical protein